MGDSMFWTPKLIYPCDNLSVHVLLSLFCFKNNIIACYSIQENWFAYKQKVVHNTMETFCSWLVGSDFYLRLSSHIYRESQKRSFNINKDLKYYWDVYWILLNLLAVTYSLFIRANIWSKEISMFHVFWDTLYINIYLSICFTISVLVYI